MWGSFRHDDAVLAWAGVVDEELFASVFIGHADGQRRALGLTRSRRPVATRARVKRVEP